MLVYLQDTAGQERFASMHPSYYFRAHACILVFDVTRKVTYQHLQEWYDELQQYRPGLPTLVVANKIDGQQTTHTLDDTAAAAD
jgi:Rab-like protein 2